MYRIQNIDFISNPPATNCITRDEVKVLASVTDTTLDAVIDLIIPIVQGFAERITGRLLASRTVTLEAALPRGDGYYQLQGYPVTGITSVTVYDGEGGSEAVALGDLLVMGTHAPRVRIQTFTSGAEFGYVRFEYVAGYNNTVKIPPDIKGDVLRLATTLLENREDYGVSSEALVALPAAATAIANLKRNRLRVY